jgi:FKBP-type peptidyl-prolyl cis-trans isomerase
MSKITVAVAVIAVALVALTAYLLWANSKNAQSQMTEQSVAQTETKATETDKNATKTTEPTIAPEAGASDLKIETIKQGAGDRVTKSGDMISVHYTGTLASTGAKFDSSLDRGTPFRFDLGAGQVIKGWDQGLLGMKVGEKRKLTIPPALGYGDEAMGTKIPANSTLIFEVELLEIL